MFLILGFWDLIRVVVDIVGESVVVGAGCSLCFGGSF